MYDNFQPTCTLNICTYVIFALVPSTFHVRRERKNRNGRAISLRSKTGKTPLTALRMHGMEASDDALSHTHPTYLFFPGRYDGCPGERGRKSRMNASSATTSRSIHPFYFITQWKRGKRRRGSGEPLSWARGGSLLYLFHAAACGGGGLSLSLA